MLCLAIAVIAEGRPADASEFEEIFFVSILNRTAGVRPEAAWVVPTTAHWPLVGSMRTPGAGGVW